MKLRDFVCLFLLSSFTVSCSSLPEKMGLKVPKEEVISRIDGMSSRPDWIKESEPFSIESGKVANLGMVTVPGDSRVEASYRIAANNAKAEIAKSIEQRLSFVFQNAEEGVSLDSTQARFIGAEASELTSSSLRLDKQYWEKVFAVDENGVSKTFYRVYALVKMPEADFKAAVLAAAKKRNGQNGISKDFSKKVDAHWDKFVDADTSTASE